MALVLFCDCSFKGRGLQGEGREGCSCSYRDSATRTLGWLPVGAGCTAQEQLQEAGGRTAADLCSCQRLKLPPANFCPPAKWVRGGTAWPDLLHHHRSAISRTHLRSLTLWQPSQGVKVSKVFQSGFLETVASAAGSGSGLVLQQWLLQKDDFSLLWKNQPEIETSNRQGICPKFHTAEIFG